MQVYLDAGATRFGKLLDRFEALNIRGCRIGHGPMSDHKSTIFELSQWRTKRKKSRHIYVTKGDSREEIIAKADEIASWATKYDVVDGITLEIGNEVNLAPAWEDNPELIGETTVSVLERVAQSGVQVISPSISNIGSKELAYAKAMLGQIPDSVPFAFHRYKVPDLLLPRSEYGSREEEIDALLAVSQGRELWLTETGQAEIYYRNKPFPRCWQREMFTHSEDEIARQIAGELQYWKESNLLAAIVFYQLNDGPDASDKEHRFGWRRFGDTYQDEWKVVSRVMPPLIAQADQADQPDYPDPVGEPSRKALAKQRWLHETQPTKDVIPLGNSLFHALALDMPRDHYSKVIDNLSGVVNEARFNMSTLGWGDGGPETQTAPAVISFKKGGAPDYWGYSREISPAFLDEMEWRLAYAVSRGVRPQLTIFWGAFQDMFLKSHSNTDVVFNENAIRNYLTALCNRLKDHPAVNLELMNEINHGSHLHAIGRKGRREFIVKWGDYIKRILPDHLLTVSGENIDKNGREGGYHFAYHNVSSLDYWSVHFDRSKRPAVEGFPPWCRSTWHLNEEPHSFRSTHAGKGYGRNDEPIFLQTKKQHQGWPYGGSTLDWQMYGVSIFETLCAGVATTIHNQSGFFLGYHKKKDPNPDFPLSEPIYDVARFYQRIMKDFPVGGAVPFNSGWTGSPVRDTQGCFKAFSLAGGKKRDQIIITVLGPENASLTLELLAKSYNITAYEITGEKISETTIGPGTSKYKVPNPGWMACVLHLKAI